MKVCFTITVLTWYPHVPLFFKYHLQQISPTMFKETNLKKLDCFKNAQNLVLLKTICFLEKVALRIVDAIATCTSLTSIVLAFLCLAKAHAEMIVFSMKSSAMWSNRFSTSSSSTSCGSTSFVSSRSFFLLRIVVV